jgi:hypothetical protein
MSYRADPRSVLYIAAWYSTHPSATRAHATNIPSTKYIPLSKTLSKRKKNTKTRNI